MDADEFDREAALDAEDAAWENSDEEDDDAAPQIDDDGSDDDAPDEAANAPRAVDEDGFSDDDAPAEAANAAPVNDEPPRARRRTGALRRVEAAAAKRRQLAEPAADFIEVPTPAPIAPPPAPERRTRVAQNIFVSDERTHRSLFDARPSASALEVEQLKFGAAPRAVAAAHVASTDLSSSTPAPAAGRKRRRQPKAKASAAEAPKRACHGRGRRKRKGDAPAAKPGRKSSDAPAAPKPRARRKSSAEAPAARPRKSSVGAAPAPARPRRKSSEAPAATSRPRRKAATYSQED
jgi:hypothetical protein